MTRQEERKPVDALNDNDVLLGRGSGPSEYVGNKRFRHIVSENREEYVACSKPKEKNVIAKRVYDSVISASGRFLCLSQDDKPVDYMVEDGIWYVETNVKKCMEKCRQALRQKRTAPTSQAPDTTRNANQDSANSTPPQPSMFASLSVPQQPSMYASSLPAPPEPCLVPVVIPSALVGAAVVSPPAMLDARLLLYQTDLHMQAQLRQNQMVLDTRQPIWSSFVTNPTVASFQQQQQAQLPVSNPIAQERSSQPEANKKHSLHQQHLTASHHLDNTASAEEDSLMKKPNVGGTVASTISNDDKPAEEEEVSEYLLSVLALSGRAKFTDEQEEAEKANMTDQEKAKVLCDLFGKYCSVHHQDKKAKRDLGTKDIAFLVKQMRMEIEKIPVAEKQALMEAQQKCNRLEEFSDHRLEQFLRCEGMDVKVRCFFRPKLFRPIRARWLVHTHSYPTHG